MKENTEITRAMFEDEMGLNADDKNALEMTAPTFDKKDSLNYSQWAIQSGGRYTPTMSTTSRLPSGFYEIGHDGQMGTFMELKKVNTDELYQLPSPELTDIIEDIFDNGETKKIEVSIKKDAVKNDITLLPIDGQASEFAVSPDGTEIVYVARGEVFVSSVEFGTTKQITNTPQQERNVSFSPDGKKILFAAERGDSWDIYEVSRVSNTEKHFYNATLLKETVLIDSKDEDFDLLGAPMIDERRDEEIAGDKPPHHS